MRHTPIGAPAITGRAACWLAYSPDIPAGATLPTLAMEDIGASIAARLGVRLDDVDGTPANWLCGGPA